MAPQPLQIRIDVRPGPMLCVTDNGGGMTAGGLHRMMSFGVSSCVAGDIGRYGNGFKSSSMRLGADALVLSVSRETRHFAAGLLSFSFLRATDAQDIFVPIVEWDEHGRPSNAEALQTLLKWGPGWSEAQLQTELRKLRLSHCREPLRVWQRGKLGLIERMCDKRMIFRRQVLKHRLCPQADLTGHVRTHRRGPFHLLHVLGTTRWIARERERDRDVVCGGEFGDPVKLNIVVGEVVDHLKESATTLGHSRHHLRQFAPTYISGWDGHPSRVSVHERAGGGETERP